MSIDSQGYSAPAHSPNLNVLTDHGMQALVKYVFSSTPDTS